jgi:hypothetical protein
MRNNSDNKKSYAEKLKDPRWQKKRLEIMQRDGFKCLACGDTETSLQVHHKKYVSGKEPWEYLNSDLITLCEHCHYELERITSFREELRLPYGNIRICKSYGGTFRKMYVSFPGYLFHAIYDSTDREIFSWVMEAEKTGKQFLELVKNSFDGK